MKTKYKILIISLMVISIITCFMITSFAAVTTTDITYDNNTYTYKSTLANSNQVNRIQIWDYNNLYYVINNEIRQFNYDNIIIYFNAMNASYQFYYNSESLLNYIYSNLNYIIIDGPNTKISTTVSFNFDNTLTNKNDTSSNEYMVWQNNDMVSIPTQLNILNNTQPNPLEKVDDFLTYLSTSLNKLTTMIITNQILILFIVAVPVVSFVIGSFKRIKDSGRV